MNASKTKYWFKAKKYGWGWYPVTWQGWMVLVGFIILTWLHSEQFENNSPQDPLAQIKFFIILGALILGLLLLCFKTGEKPQWRWAGKPLKYFFKKS